MAKEMDNLRGLWGIRKKNRIPNARVREFCDVKKRVGERIDENFLLWFGHMKKMKNNRNAKRVWEAIQWVEQEKGGLIQRMTV